MRGSKNRSTPSLPPALLPNAFNPDFLRRFRARDLLAPSAGEANAVGPWVIEEIVPDGVNPLGISYARGYAPTAIFVDRWLALVAAAVLPGLGQTRCSSVARGKMIGLATSKRQVFKRLSGEHLTGKLE
jgi:hypothetical protein